MIFGWIIAGIIAVVAGLIPFFIPNYATSDGMQAVILFLFMIIYYGLVWVWYGRDKYALFPKYVRNISPEITPALCHIVWTNGIPDMVKLCMVNLIQMAQNKFIKIEKNGKSFMIIRSNKRPETRIEKLYYDEMDKVERIDGLRFSRNLYHFSRINFNLEKKVYTRTCLLNNDPFLIGAGLLILLFWLLRFPVIMALLTSMAVCVFYFLIVWSPLFSPHRRPFKTVGLCVVLLACISGGFLHFDAEKYRILSTSIIFFGILPLFFYLLQQPTRIGAEKISRAEGIKLFLNRMSIVDVIKLTSKEVVRLYPYAWAGGLTEKWYRICFPKISRSKESEDIYNQKFISRFEKSLAKSLTMTHRCRIFLKEK